MTLTRALASLIVLAACLPAVGAEDWPKWLGPRGDNISKEDVAVDWPEDGPAQVWSARVGEGHASPVALDGKIYLFTLDGSDEALTCFDAAAGKMIWRQTYSIGKKPQYPGTRATPTIEGDRIYTLGESGDLVCRELDGGKQVWLTNVLRETGAKMLMWGCASSPLIVGDRIFVQTGEGGPIACAVDKNTGKVEWKAEARSKAGYASLVHAEVNGKPQLFIFAGKALGALDPATGKAIWSEDFETRYDVNAATPVYRDGRVLFTAEYDNGRAVMYEVTDTSYKKLWQNQSLKSKFQPVILDGDFIYGNSGGDLVCLNWNTGELAWQANEKSMRLGPGGSLLRAGGDKLITMSERGRLSLVRAMPDGYKLLTSFQLFDADQIWASPLLYDGKLYCKGRDELVCLDVGVKK